MNIEELRISHRYLLSNEHRAKISEYNSGKKVSDKTRAKMSKTKEEWYSVNIISDETRANISKVQTGKKLSDETHAKISNTTKGTKR